MNSNFKFFLISIRKFLSNSWEKGTNIDDLTVFFAVLIGSCAHLSFYFIFKFFFELQESFFMRFIAVILSFILTFLYLKRTAYRKFFLELYWHVMLIWILPFVFTYNLLVNDFHELWLYWEIFMIFVLILYVPHWFMLIINLVIGVVLAMTSYFMMYGSFASLDFSQFNYILYSIVILFSLITGLSFSFASRTSYTNLLRQQYKKTISMAGSIAHEMRNPISAIKLSQESLPNLNSLDQLRNMTLEDLKLFNDHRAIVDKTIKLSNDIIDMTLDQLSGKEIEKKDFVFSHVNDIITDSISTYGYKSQEQKKRIKVNLKQNFVIHAVETPVKYILFNLIKNSLYYSKYFSDLEIEVGVEERQIGGRTYNTIYILDNGPGISTENTFKLFDDFFTSGKKEGTGLGLAFCRRNMRAFGGDIICESEFGGFDKNGNQLSGSTKFILLFPVISDEELEQFGVFSNTNHTDIKASKNTAYRILIVDDEQVNILTTKAKIEKNLNIICDVATNGEEAINKVKKSIKNNQNYSLILTDIQMPIMDGIKSAKKIKEINQQAIVIALTSLSYKELSEQDSEIFNYYLQKPIAGHILLRTITKFIPELNDNLDYLGEDEQFLGDIEGKRVVLVDDQDLNLIITTKKLTNLGLDVVALNDGDKLVEYVANYLAENQNTEDKNPKKIDLIITDINMNRLDGDEAAKQIRIIENEHNISNKDQIPIIALSGDGQKDDIMRYLTNMTDYYIKGTDVNRLVRIIASYLTPNKIYFNKSHSKNQKISTNSSQENNRDKLPNTMVIKSESPLTPRKILNYDKLRYFEEKDKKELLKIFVTEGQKRLDKIKSSNNSEIISKEIHALKGVAGNIGAEIFYDKLNSKQSAIKDLQEEEICGIEHLLTGIIKKMG